MGPKPRRVVRLACQAAARPRDGHAFPRGHASPRNAQTGCSWHRAAALFSPLGKKPARENAIHPLAQAKGLSGGEAVTALPCFGRLSACPPSHGVTTAARVLYVAAAWRAMYNTQA